MELFTVYDENRINTGKIIKRGDTFPPGAYHLVVHVCIMNTKGEMLLQQRQPFKAGWSNLWDVTCGGSATAGDTSKAAAQRELFEELGLAVDFTNIRAKFTSHFEFGFDDWYVFTQDVDLAQLTLQYEEVQGVKWASKSEILAKIDAEEFVPYRKSIIELVFELANTRGILSTDH